MPLNDYSWGTRFWADLFEVVSGRKILQLVDKMLAFATGLTSGLNFESTNAIGVVFMEDLPTTWDEGLDRVAQLIAWEMGVVTGLTINPEHIKKAIDGVPDADDRISLGKTLADPFFAIFDVPEVAKGYKDRLPGTGEIRNLQRFIGSNLRLQMGGMAINTVSSVLPHNLPGAFTDIPEKVDRVLGWEDLMEEIIQEPIQKLVSEGLASNFLRLTKPIDYSFTEAIRAYHAGIIDKPLLFKVFDNLGYRDDIRDHLIEVNEADLTDSDLKKLLKAKRVTDEEVLKSFRLKGYGKKKAEHKLFLLKQEDEDSAFDKIDQGYLNLYRDCVISRLELEQWLTQRGRSQEEINAAIALEEIERKQRRWLTMSDYKEALAKGLLSMEQIHDGLVCQGMTGPDATIAIAMMIEEDKLPADCFSKIKPVDIKQGFAAIWALLLSQGYLLPSQIAAFLKCLGITDFPSLPDSEAPDQAPAPKLPSGSFSALPSSPDPGEQFRLVWNIQNADTVSINQGIGVVGPQETRFLTARANTVWRLTATNAEGTREFQASILVRPAPEAPVPKLPKPTVTFSITPSAAEEGTESALQWTTANATQVFLDEGLGPKAVALSGAKFRLADQSRVFTITASGSGGQTTRADTQIVRPQPPERQLQPRASLTVTPGQVVRGERVEVRWSTTNAASATLDFGSGPLSVPLVGVQILNADRDRILVLRAEGVEGAPAKVVMDALIVDPPPATTEPTAPKPTASLTIRPSRAKRGSTVAVEWRTAGATEVVLLRSSGTQSLAPVGAMTLEAVATEIMILRASTLTQTTTVAKVLVVEAPASA